MPVAQEIRQLTFDSLAGGLQSADVGEVIRSAPARHRRVRKNVLVPGTIKQATFDELFAAAPTLERAGGIPETQEKTHHENDATTQPHFAALAGLSADDVREVSDGEQVGGGVREDGRAGERPALPSGDRGEDGLSGSLGNSAGAILPGRRRIILQEVEPERQPSRDLRITEAHGIGSGGLHEKATANIEAIKLLQTLEAEERDATEAEKAVLVRYSGWGALAQIFEPDWKVRPEWKTAAKEVKQLLTEEEYEKARATTPNAHFTSPQVVTAIWEGLQKLGVHGNIEVLEPAMGVGHFFGLMPEELQGGHRTGVELDPLTARIARKLYPDSTIFAQGFEETALPDNYFDVVVGNVPFGDYGVHDPSMKPSALTRPIHDYFFAKSLKKVRIGGVMALITSRYTMDKQDDTVRGYLAEHADLVAAVRLPNTAFKGNAGTEVTTDILFLKKRAPGEAPAGESWTQTQAVEIEGTPVPLNEYYIRHPDMMLGTMELTGTMYRGKEPTLAGELTPEILSHVMQRLPDGVWSKRWEKEKPKPQTRVEPEQVRSIKDGGYAEVQGELVMRNGDSLESVHLSAMEALRVRGLLRIRDAVRKVFETQLEDAGEEQIREAREHLNQVYDQFVGKFGAINARENYRLFETDPDHPLLLSLENFDPELKTAAKTAIFEKRTLERYQPVSHVETATEALAVSLNELGGVGWERMAELTGESIRQLQVELVGQVFQTPQGVWETADEYLSGDVRSKLRTAEAAAAINPVFARNVEALRAVQPEDIKPGDIQARLGASWIPKSDIADFIAETLQLPRGDVSVGHAGAIATWSVKLDVLTARNVSNTTTYGTKRKSAADLIEDALNLRLPTIYDTLPDETRVVNQAETIAAREAQQKLKDLFTQWVWKDSTRAERLARLYNDTFNTIRLRTYDGSHLTFPGMNKTMLRRGELDPHQKNAVWRMLQNKNALIGHCVGAGKTNEITAACMELKRMGLAKKPMIVVPNHLVEQWGAAFLALYPNANIFVAGKDFFTKGKREKAMARIASGTYDAVIVSHKSFESLPVSDATFNRFVRKEIASLEEALREVQAEKGENRSIVKQLEKAKKRLEAKIKDRAKRESKDDGVTFEQLGIDRIFVDEADLYKNLGFTTKMQRIAGLPNTESNRALDMYMKTRYLSERDGGVVFATGTPISNTMAEMYTLMRYLAPQVLEAAGVSHFDAWAANFGEAVTSLELAPDGSGYRMHTRFAKFVNLPELLSMFRSFADIQTAEMLNLPRPDIAGGKPKAVVSPATGELKAYVSRLVERAQRIRNGSVDPRIDNMLNITTDGRKAALDMRLVEAAAEVNGEGKVSQAVETIHRLWNATKQKRLTQLVFCDLSTPHPDRFNVYHSLRSHLRERDIPEQEVAFIHDADTDAKKKQLFDAVNAGRVRVLIGSTEKMGAGTNVQKRLVALHHLDAPWRPRDIEQREGRILRQGNQNPTVGIYRYVTEGSFDAYMWQTLETKARFIQQVMSGSVSVREAEDLEGGALSYAEIKAIASGNPMVLEKVRIDTEVRRLDLLRATHLNQQYEIGRQVAALPSQIAKSREYHEGLLHDISRRDANSGEFSMTVEGREYSGKGAREQAGEALKKSMMDLLWGERGGATQIGSYKGFAMLASISGREGEGPKLYLRGTHTYEANVNPESALGTIAGIENVLRRLDGYVEEERGEIARKEKALADYSAQLHRPFEHEEQLRELLVKQEEINHQLDLGKSEVQVVAEEEQEESGGEGIPFALRRTAHAQVYAPMASD
jgi:N12 class adenine-specific DNA methylase